MNNLTRRSDSAGFTLIELLVTASILGILASIAMVNLSSTWTRSRLLSTTRELENWLSDQRRYAMNNNLTCRVSIDHNNKQLVSTIDSSSGTELCIDDESLPGQGVFNLAEHFGQGHEKLALLSTPSTDPNHSDGGIRFSFRGFSQNHQLSSEGILELRLKHEDLQQQRCIRIISPIGMMRDGRAEDQLSGCHYDKTY
jgi:prepilin-type N-terminal cleavage/methylation domain-containing protein